MNLLEKLRNREVGRRSRIGAGKLVLVVGPSGAGKDTLIGLVQSAYGENSNVVFPRRVVTRPPSEFEDHDSLSPKAFREAIAKGAFAFCWEAHGLFYGVPATIDADIRDGRTVVCNVSRTVVSAVRDRYARVVVVLVTAPQDILVARLVARERATDGSAQERLRRSETIESGIDPDLVIENVGRPEIEAQKLLAVVRDANFLLF